LRKKTVLKNFHTLDVILKLKVVTVQRHMPKICQAAYGGLAPRAFRTNGNLFIQRQEKQELMIGIFASDIPL
jgi:hypothetical protein